MYIKNGWPNLMREIFDVHQNPQLVLSSILCFHIQHHVARITVPVVAIVIMHYGQRHQKYSQMLFR
jgi:hypothetical protein